MDTRTMMWFVWSVISIVVDSIIIYSFYVMWVGLLTDLLVFMHRYFSVATIIIYIDITLASWLGLI